MWCLVCCLADPAGAPPPADPMAVDAQPPVEAAGGTGAAAAAKPGRATTDLGHRLARQRSRSGSGPGSGSGSRLTARSCSTQLLRCLLCSSCVAGRRAPWSCAAARCCWHQACARRRSGSNGGSR
jgi:hypothetical protein